jgi:hypothetical protein
MENLNVSRAVALTGPYLGDRVSRYRPGILAYLRGRIALMTAVAALGSASRTGSNYEGDRPMTQLKNIRNVIAMTTLLAGLAMTGVSAFAQTSTPAPGGDHGKGMMSSGEAMKPGMMVMDPEMRRKMSRMMDNCDRMMESMVPKDGGTTPSVPNKG